MQSSKLCTVAVGHTNGDYEDEAIRAATINPARQLGCADEVGSIEKGKYADFVVCT